MENLADVLAKAYMHINELQNWQYFLLSGVLFMGLAFLFPGNKNQPFFHKAMIADTIYWFGSSYITRPFGWLLGIVIYNSLYSQESIVEIQNAGIPPLNQLPLWVQALLVMLVMDFMQYGTHRLFHTGKLWKFHAIHHSPINVDWLTCSRFHPVNVIVHSTLVAVIVSAMGFSPYVWAIIGPFNMIYSPLVHANLNWTYGPFRYFLASPVFHRWHHTHMKEGGSSNFAPTFPFIDIMFGTYYDPKDKKPTIFGAENDPVPENIIGQLIYPFVKKDFFVKRNNIND